MKCYISSCPSAWYEARPIRLHLYGITQFAVAYPTVNGRDTIAHACLFSVHNRICHRKLKMQSDWSHLVRGAGTTRCIALYQTLSLPFPLRPLFPERESGCARLIYRWVVILLTVTVLAGAGQGTPPPPPPPPRQHTFSYLFGWIASFSRDPLKPRKVDFLLLQTGF